jgi:hypothetical protein
MALANFLPVSTVVGLWTLHVLRGYANDDERRRVMRQLNTGLSSPSI